MKAIRLRFRLWRAADAIVMLVAYGAAAVAVGSGLIGSAIQLWSQYHYGLDASSWPSFVEAFFGSTVVAVYGLAISVFVLPSKFR